MENIIKRQSIIKEKIVNKLLLHKDILFILLISILGFVSRLTLFKATSGDFNIFLHPWYVTIKHYGFNVLSHQVGNYGILYQFIILLMTYIPIRDLYAYKMVSIIFDYILAVAAALLACEFSTSKNKASTFLLCYSSVLLLPTLILNSAWWAQCDSIYSTFLCISLLFLFRERYALSFIFYGLAFAFKLQAVFLLPFFVLLYFIKKRIFISHYFLALLAFWITGLPGYLYGRNLFSLFWIYWKGQITIQNTVHKEYFNLSCIFGNPNLIYSKWLADFLLVLMVSILLIGFFVFINEQIFNNFQLFLLAIWTFYTCMMFMPYLQQRYGYVLDILLIVISFIRKEYIMITIPELILSFVSYMPALFIPKLFINNNNIPFMITLSCIALLLYSAFTYLIFCKKESLGSSLKEVNEIKE